MKKIILVPISIFSFSFLLAQEPADALRYSWYTSGGSARIQAVGGANGSLGGDISSTFINPAGLAFYKTGDFILSPAYSFGKNKATYLTRNESEKNTSKFLFGTSGFVLGTGGSGNIRGGAFSIAFNRTADFNNNILYRGVNNQSSFSQKFLEEIRSNNDKDANVVSSNVGRNSPNFRPNYLYGTSLAFNTYWIDTIGGSTNGNFQFQSRAANLLNSGLLQQNTVETRGGINEFAFGLAVNLRDKLYIGGSFGVPLINYERNAEFVEADATTNSNNKFDYAKFGETFSTSGVGLNLKAGVIYKPQEYWRLGFSVHSPTIYSLTDKFNYTVTTNTENYQGTQSQSSEFLAGMAGEFKYLLITPYKLVGSVSYVLREVEDVRKQKGFITADIEFIDHGASSFKEDTEVSNDADTKAYLKSLSDAVRKAYKGAFNFRVGGELKFTTFMVRAGAGYYSNPYKNIHGENGNRINLSGGLGYRNKGFFIDATYVHGITKDTHFAYRLQNSPYAAASIKGTKSNVLLTVGFKI